MRSVMPTVHCDAITRQAIRQAAYLDLIRAGYGDEVADRIVTIHRTAGLSFDEAVERVLMVPDPTTTTHQAQCGPENV